MLCGFAYFVTLPWQPYPASFIVKGLSVAALAILAFITGTPILGFGLAISSLGDVLLDLDPERLFVYGLGSFLAAHLIYIFLFVRNRRRPMAPGVAQWLAIAAVLVYSATVASWLVPSLGDFVAPVAVYMCAITAMVISAIFARFSNPWVAAGAILFLISDSLLAVNKFKMQVPYRDFLVWSTYYLAQYAITFGFLKNTPAPARLTL